MSSVFRDRMSGRVARFVAALAFAGMLMSSDCCWCSGDCCGCDCRCNCNNCSNCGNCGGCGGCCCNNATIDPNSGITDLAAYEIQTFEIIPSTEPRRHPIRALTDIDGLSVPMLIGVNQLTVPALRLFIDRLLAANQDLLALPPDAGEVAFGSLRTTDDEMIVTYKQLEPGASSRRPRFVASDALRFHFDHAGNLKRIDNRMIVVP